MMNRTTGRTIGDADHLRQSVADILTTPIGSRVMRRDYGSLVPALIDQPHNPALASRINAAAVSALMRWEPRLLVRRIQLRRDTDHASRGTLYIDASVRAIGRAKPIALEVRL